MFDSNQETFSNLCFTPPVGFDGSRGIICQCKASITASFTLSATYLYMQVIMLCSVILPSCLPQLTMPYSMAYNVIENGEGDFVRPKNRVLICEK